MTEQEEGGQEAGVVRVPFRWQDASDLPTVYANHAYVTHMGKEFYVVFGEAQVPILTGMEPTELEEIKVKPVAKLVFTPEGIDSIVSVLADNVRKSKERQEREKEAN